MERQSARDPGDVGASVGVREAFQKQHLVVIEHPELSVLAQRRLHLLHRRQCGLSQPKGERPARRQFPQPHPDSGAAILVPFEQTGGDETRDQSVCG